MTQHVATSTQPDAAENPRGDLAGFARYFKYDLVSGFLVFLIALPLCLGIALACGYPAIAGIFTAIVGAIVCTFLSNSELTIKGPAAGLIVIAIGCVESFGGDGAVGGFTAQDMSAYRMALAVGVAAAVLQILFGFLRAGILGEFFPLSAVHGMLAAIGVIIIIKQIPVALGVQGSGEPLEMLREIPNYVRELNPEIALIGAVGVLIMFLWPLIQKSTRPLKAIPGAMVVLLATVPLGIYFDLLHTHAYTFHGHTYEVGESYLVNMPDRVFGMMDYITTPDFSAFSAPHLPSALKWVFMFFVIGSLESLLSAKAVDIIDPWKRKTNLDRDMIAVGAGNLCSAMIGGLPMISEIVRSKANIDNGARTRFSDLWHGIFLLVCVSLIPTLLHRIPLAALAAMLIYTGFRLTHPQEFMHVYKVGKEQLLVFVATLVGVLATDLLIGIVIGMAVELVIHMIHGVPFRSLFKSHLEVNVDGDNSAVVQARHSAVFTNWIRVRTQIVRVGLREGRNVTVDLSQCKLVDHSVMEKLHELEHDFQHAGLRLHVRGLEAHRQLSPHDFAARKRALTRLRRVTTVAPEDLETALTSKFIELGATGYTSIPCYGMGREAIARGMTSEISQCRIETVVSSEVAERILDFLRADIDPCHKVTVCVETVEVLRQDDFVTAS
jgi:MFS superfamily sulfate permease-like transporter